MSPNPVTVDQHSAMSAIQAGSARDDHDVRSTEITEDEVVGVKQLDGILDVLEDIVRKEFPSLARFPSHLSVDMVVTNRHIPAHTRATSAQSPRLRGGGALQDDIGQ